MEKKLGWEPKGKKITDDLYGIPRFVFAQEDGKKKAGCGCGSSE